MKKNKTEVLVLSMENFVDQDEKTVVPTERLKREFRYIISHKIRRPVANIIGLVSMLEAAEDLDPNHRDIISALRDVSTELDEVFKEATCNYL